MAGSEHMVGSMEGSVVLNETTIPNSEVWEALGNTDPEGMGDVERALVNWGKSTRKAGSIFDRDRFVTPDKVFHQFKMALDAAESDDVVSGIVETTEALAYNKVSMSSEDEDEEDIWNQIIEDLDLITRMREMWREMFIVSQFYCGIMWGRKTYTVRGSGTSRKRRKSYDLFVPIGLTLFDPMTVLPVGSFMFRKDQLVYIADKTQAGTIDQVLAGDNSTDLVVDQFLGGRYELDRPDRNRLQEVTGADYLEGTFLMNSENVFRHTATRPDYQRFATVRMKSVFELLDLKQQLRQMDRAHLLGGPLRVDQKVWTENGSKAIGDTVVGDKVYGPSGELVDVVGVYPQGVLSMNKVEFTDGSVVYCDDSHWWTVENRGLKSNKMETIQLSEIKERGITFNNGGTGAYRWRVPMTAPVEYPERDFPMHPYLLGYMLGDGSFGQTSPKIHSAETDHPWSDVLPDGVRTTVHDFEEGRCPQYVIAGVEWRNNPLMKAIEALNLRGVTGVNKFVPEQYMTGSVAQRVDLLAGLFDSDGHVLNTPDMKGAIEFFNTSESLCDSVVELVQSLGGVAVKRLRTQDPRPNHKPCWRVLVHWNNELEPPLRLQRKLNSWEHKEKPIFRAIKSITPSLDAEAVCIKVDSEDGLFLTESYVTTHNTNFIIVFKRGSDANPARQGDLASLKTQVQNAARIPVIIGDHTIDVEIITPKLDLTMSPERYNTLDARITARLYQILMSGNYAAGSKGDDSIKLARFIARSMESRRAAIGDAIYKNVLLKTFERNVPQFKYLPKLNFHPKRISLDFDATASQYMLDLRDRGDLSRETILREIDLDQDEEYRLRQREVQFDKVFQPTNVPFGAAGRAGGGNANGGGTNRKAGRPEGSPTTEDENELDQEE